MTRRTIWTRTRVHRPDNDTLHKVYSGPEPPAARGGTRLYALDVLRGLAIAGMFVVGSKSPFPQFRHASWFGYTIADIIYPAFLFAVGFSMALSVTAKDARGVPSRLQHR
ncbi:MAG: DUF1624 domain-containing protein, partial [Bdellovibrionales bacterium]|nr:DUF1624 domain-containing protein [Bdellovibrionales bacterium]